MASSGPTLPLADWEGEVLVDAIQRLSASANVIVFHNFGSFEPQAFRTRPE
jgi:hypothetical protein